MGAFFQDPTPEIKVTVAENSERHSMTPTHIHKLNLGVNMSYNIWDMFLTLCFACCRWVVLSVNWFGLHTAVMLTVCYLNRQPEASSTTRVLASARERLLFWYLSLFVMCKAWHQYNERSRALALLNSPQVEGNKCGWERRKQKE